MIEFRKSFQDFDYGIFLSVFLLVVLGLATVYSATHSINLFLFKKQLIWVLIAVIVGVIFFLIPCKFWSSFSYPFYAICLLLLVLVLIFGVKVRGVKRWFDFGFLQFQPSELAKLACVMALASIFSNRRIKFESIFSLGLPLILIIIPFILILVEPDIGSSLVLPAIFIGMLFIKGIKIEYIILLLTPLIALIAGTRWFMLIGFLSILSFALYFMKLPLEESISIFSVNVIFGVLNPVIWGSLREYQRARIIGFLVPGHDPAGAGWQILQSRIAIGSGGLFGKGFLSGTQTEFAFLPQGYTDFIFSVLAEEMGFFISIFILFLFFLFLFRAIRISAGSRNSFHSYLGFGIIAILGFQVLVNIGMTMGMLPVVGIPLPFISYGGSSMVISLAMVGLLLNIGKHRYEY